MNEKYERDDVVIILPKAEIPPLKRITLFLLGFSGALSYSAFINLNESLVLVALGIVLFLLFFDEGFRRLF